MRRRAAGAVVGGALVVGTMGLGAEEASAQSWEGNPAQNYSFAAVNIVNYWKTTYGLTMSMNAKVLSAAPGNGTLNFYKDSLRASVPGMGPSGVFGGCLYMPNPTARHGNPFYSHSHTGVEGQDALEPTTKAYQYKWTADYKETGYTDPHLVHRQPIYTISTNVCYVVGSYVFDHVYK